MRKRKWEKIINYQVENYYRNVEDETPRVKKIKDDILKNLTNLIDE